MAAVTKKEQKQPLLASMHHPAGHTPGEIPMATPLFEDSPAYQVLSGHNLLETKFRYAALASLSACASSDLDPARVQCVAHSMLR